MKMWVDTADASWYYHESSDAVYARMDSSAVYGNLADAMKNSIILLPTDTPAATLLPFEEHYDAGAGDEEAWAVLTIPA